MLIKVSLNKIHTLKRIHNKNIKQQQLNVMSFKNVRMSEISFYSLQMQSYIIMYNSLKVSSGVPELL